MTLIANTMNFGYPILIGDILMSSEDSSKNPKIPSFKKGVKDLLDDKIKDYPYYLRQKIYIINDNIAVGLGGSEQHMKLFLEDIRIAFNYLENNQEVIKKYLDEYEFSSLKELSYLIIMAEHNDKEITISCFQDANSLSIRSDQFDETHAFGSGAKGFMDSLMMIRKIEKVEKRTLATSIAENYTLISEIMVNERLTLDTIKEAWGAGFELIYYDGTKFKKVNDITFVIWKGEYDVKTKKVNCMPVFFINQRYYEDLLLISAGDPEGVEGYVIPPINRIPTNEEIKKIPLGLHFDSNMKCCAFIVELPKNEMVTPTMFLNESVRPGRFAISMDDQNRLTFNVDLSYFRLFWDNVAVQIQKQLDELL